MTNNLIYLNRRKLLLKGNLMIAQKYNLNNEVKIARRELAKVNKEIQNLNKGGIIVSDHAIVRHFERACGVDREALEEAVFPKQYHDIALKLGKCEITLADGSVAVIQDNTVVTVTKK